MGSRWVIAESLHGLTGKDGGYCFSYNSLIERILFSVGFSLRSSYLTGFWSHASSPRLLTVIRRRIPVLTHAPTHSNSTKACSAETKVNDAVMDGHAP